MEERLAQLEMLLLSAGKIAGVGLVPSFDDGQVLLNACMEHSLEGRRFQAKGFHLHVGTRKALGQVQNADMASGEQGPLEADRGAVTPVGYPAKDRP